MFSKKQSEQRILIERSVKTTIQELYDMGFFDQYKNADETKDQLFTERCRGSH